MELNLCRRIKVLISSSFVYLLLITMTFVLSPIVAFAQQDDLLEEESMTSTLPMDEEIPTPTPTPTDRDENYVLKEVPAGSSSALVEVQRAEDPFKSYLQRRARSGFLFSVSSTEILMENMTTLEGTNEIPYDELYTGDTVPMAEIFIGYKFNFPTLASVHLDIGYGHMETESAVSGTKRKIAIDKPEVRAGIILDGLFSEPYVAPYFNATAWKMSVTESNSTDSQSYDTAIGFSYTFGLLFQLNWLDPQPAYQVRSGYKVQNTYLDVFVTQLMETQGENDPDTSTEPSYGVGLRLEF